MLNNQHDTLTDDTLTPTANDMHTPISKNDHASICASIVDEGFKKLELQIYELNKSVNSELALLNRRLDSFSDHFNKPINSSLPSQNEKSSEENISLLKKNLCMKEEIIKKLVENQNTVLNTISAKPNTQHSDILNQSSSSLTCNKLNENSRNTKQLTSQGPQDPLVARRYSSQLQKISHPIQAHHQRPEQYTSVKNIYVGNLPEDIPKQVVCELFVLDSTSYLRDTCCIDFPINNKTGKSKGFVFRRTPAHITDELIKLDGIAYRDNELTVEDATSTRKRTRNNISSKARRPSVVVNNHPGNQHSFGRKFSPPESKFSKRKMVIFSHSIPRGEFNFWLHKGYAQLKSCPGGKSNELLYYVEPTLQNKNFDDILLHVGVNDLLNDESQDSVQNLLDNLRQIGLKCKSAGVKRVLISGIVVNNKLASAYISSLNQRISNMCRDNSFVFIDNNNIPTSSLFRDGLHLLEVGKRILANNFIDNLNNFLRIRQTHRLHLNSRKHIHQLLQGKQRE